MEVDTIFDIVQNLDHSPLESWNLIHKLRNVAENKDPDAASCTKIARVS